MMNSKIKMFMLVVALMAQGSFTINAVESSEAAQADNDVVAWDPSEAENARQAFKAIEKSFFKFRQKFDSFCETFNNDHKLDIDKNIYQLIDNISLSLSILLNKCKTMDRENFNKLGAVKKLTNLIKSESGWLLREYNSLVDYLTELTKLCEKMHEESKMNNLAWKKLSKLQTSLLMVGPSMNHFRAEFERYGS